MNQIKECALILVRDKGVKQHTIHSNIRSVLQKASEGLPKIPVAYNAMAYGCFETSDFFISFLKKNGNFDEDRVDIAQAILPFGKHVAHSFPELYELVSILQNSNIQNIISRIHLSDVYLNKIQMVEKNKIDLENHITEVCSLDGTLQTYKYED